MDSHAIFPTGSIVPCITFYLSVPNLSQLLLHCPNLSQLLLHCHSLCTHQLVSHSVCGLVAFLNPFLLGRHHYNVAVWVCWRVSPFLSGGYLDYLFSRKRGS